jgi:hypothetical protein
MNVIQVIGKYTDRGKTQIIHKNTKWRHNDFSLEVHLLAIKLVSVVSTVHLVVRELIGTHKPSPRQGCRKNLHKSGGYTKGSLGATLHLVGVFLPQRVRNRPSLAGLSREELSTFPLGCFDRLLLYLGFKIPLYRADPRLQRVGRSRWSYRHHLTLLPSSST